MTKKNTVSKKLMVITLAVTVFIGCHFTQQTLPTDVTSVCNSFISATEFNSWFETGAVSLNGAVKPANGVTFADVSPGTHNCTFYKWSEQMFLWLTSPTSKRYGGGGGLIMGSSAFFDVSPEAADFSRTLIPLSAGKLRAFNMRAAQHGAHDLPVILEKKSERLLEILPPVNAKDGKQLIRNSAGQEIEIGTVKLENGKKPVFFDVKGKEIEGARAIVQSRSDTTRNVRTNRFNRMVRSDSSDLVQKFIIEKIPVFIDLAGNVIDVEQGQSAGGVLMAQNGSLVYYTTTVNEVFAYFRTMQGTTVPPGTQFPTTQSQLDAITAFAAANGRTFIDPNALAIEVKSSWVEAAGLPDVNQFITMQATVPTYDKTDPTNWVANGQKTVLLALVGMHVVGSVAGHSEMLWATFEHISNAPSAGYTYASTSGTGSVPQSTAGNFVFCANGAVAPFNVQHMQAVGNAIQPLTGFTISPSNTLRSRPWGMPGTSSSSNSDVITINNSVRTQLVSGDLRMNYIQIGTTWSFFAGTSSLTNTTMETYQQGQNCFTCHTSSTTDVSHVFDAIKPLF